jgi:hypothetical protein
VITVVGVSLHAFGMWDKHRMEGRDQAENSLWVVVLYIQTVVLPDTTTQTQNVGNGELSGVELSLDTPVGNTVARVDTTRTCSTIRDALQPNLRPTGVPTHRAGNRRTSCASRPAWNWPTIAGAR